MNKKLYFLAILPTEEICEAITAFKKEAALRFSSSHALQSVPHITLIPPFFMNSDLSENLISRIKNLSGSILPFEVVLNQFGNFEPNVIYINVEPSHGLSQCHLGAKEVVESIISEPLQFNHPFHPHITVALKDLKASELTKAFTFFSNKSFNDSFQFEKIAVLSYNVDKWELVN